MGPEPGGGLAIALAALDHRINAAVGEEAFLSNFPLAAKVGASPYTELANYLEQHAEQRDALLANLEFFDPMNLSDAVRCPTLMNIGLKTPLAPMTRCSLPLPTSRAKEPHRVPRTGARYLHGLQRPRAQLAQAVHRVGVRPWAYRRADGSRFANSPPAAAGLGAWPRPAGTWVG